SPRGKVPILLVDDTVLFESQAICEYLDETQGDERLAPSDPVLRARDRAWFAFAGEELFGPQYRLMTTDDPTAYEQHRQGLLEKLARLEKEKTGPWLSGDGHRFGLADVAVAPVFSRFDLLEQWNGQPWLEAFPGLRAWSEALLTRPSVQH